MIPVHQSDLTTLMLRHGDWAVVNVINAGAAFSKLMAGRAIALDAEYTRYNFHQWAEEDISLYPDHPVLTSATRKWAIPTIIITSEAYEQPPHGEASTSKHNLILHYNCQCQACEEYFTKDQLTREHITPKHIAKKLGWPTRRIESWGNVTLTCITCNSRKGGQHPYKTPKNKELKGLDRPPVLPSKNRRLRAEQMRPEWHSHFKEHDLKRFGLFVKPHPAAPAGHSSGHSPTHALTNHR